MNVAGATSKIRCFVGSDNPSCSISCIRHAKLADGHALQRVDQRLARGLSLDGQTEEQIRAEAAT
jgi:hypothetical protein